MRNPVLLVSALLVTAVSGAQEPPVEEATQVRRYTVEVIIFEYAEQVSIGTERFPAEEPLIPDSAELPAEFVFEDVPSATESVAPVAEELQMDGPEFVLHLEDEFTMNDVASRLERLDVYEPIMHFAWTQVTLPEVDSLPIELPLLAEPHERLSGTFKLYLSRYLHLVVDLTLDQATANGEPVAIDESAFAYGDNRVGFRADSAAAPPVRFRIQEDRIFKNGDLRYFDHPKFGVLAKITRVEEEEPELIEPELPGDGPGDLVGDVGE